MAELMSSNAKASQSLLKVLDKEPGDLDELKDSFVKLVGDKKLSVVAFYETEPSDMTNALSGLPKHLASYVGKLFGVKTNIVVRTLRLSPLRALPKPISC